ncbi:MAG: DegT/DnrJ/EryC1/StrS family aminotransferase [Candidatus Omnitrophica bacterium]|nr:DegT/DnrJ/EryC1/StrS family aminotransferase [Candidatus Omnitrophota bacterium]
MKVPLLDLKKQYKEFKNEVSGKVYRVMAAQDFILGKAVAELEKNIAGYCHTRYAIGVASGTDALILSLKAIGVGRGDEVITTPFTFVATAEAIALVGARPVFVDIDPRTYNINPFLIEQKISRRTKAILPVHLYGLCADMGMILAIAKKYGLKVVEDAAQAIGSECKGHRAGSMGNSGGLSFFPSKNLGAFGDGGMVVTDNAKIYRMVSSLRMHGSTKRYYHNVIGYNSRLDNLQAAILNVKLRYLNRWIDARIKNAEFFNKRLEGLPLTTPFVPKGYRHSYHLYILSCAEKEEIEKYLIRSGIETRTYYPVPLHMQKCFKYLGYKRGAFPEAERASRHTFSIPVYPELTDREKKFIIGTIRRFFE